MFRKNQKLTSSKTCPNCSRGLRTPSRTPNTNLDKNTVLNYANGMLLRYWPDLKWLSRGQRRGGGSCCRPGGCCPTANGLGIWHLVQTTRKQFQDEAGPLLTGSSAIDLSSNIDIDPLIPETTGSQLPCNLRLPKKKNTSSLDKNDNWF